MCICNMVSIPMHSSLFLCLMLSLSPYWEGCSEKGEEGAIIGTPKQESPYMESNSAFVWRMHSRYIVRFQGRRRGEGFWAPFSARVRQSGKWLSMCESLCVKYVRHIESDSVSSWVCVSAVAEQSMLQGKKERKCTGRRGCYGMAERMGVIDRWLWANREKRQRMKSSKTKVNDIQDKGRFKCTLI